MLSTDGFQGAPVLAGPAPRDIPHQLAELDGIAGAVEALFVIARLCHGGRLIRFQTAPLSKIAVRWSVRPLPILDSDRWSGSLPANSTINVELSVFVQKFTKLLYAQEV